MKKQKKTIDEVIEKLKYDNETDMYIRDITTQICEWLEELKMLRALKNEHRKIGNIEGYNQGYDQGYNQGYNQALKDVYKKSFKEYDELVANDLILSITEPVLKKLANKQNEKNMKKQKKDMKVSKEEI